MRFPFAFIALLIASVVALGCSTTPQDAETCSFTMTEDLLPENNTAGYLLASSSDQLGVDFYRSMFGNDTRPLPTIRSGVLARYNSGAIPGAAMDILIIQFDEAGIAEEYTARILSTVTSATTNNSSLNTSTFQRGDLLYTSVLVEGLTNENEVDFYQEFVFWSVQQNSFMVKLTTPDVGQEPHRDVLQFLDQMAEKCH
jgi:hypothetical protein